MIPEPGGRLELPDGRGLAYDDVGDPRGRPIVYLHGCPDSRLSRHPDDAIATDAGVRLIAVDRPGYGLSDAPADWSRPSVARDVLALVDALGLDRVAVFGWSAGGPIALACAHEGRDRIAAVGVAAGVEPSISDVPIEDYLDELESLVAPRDPTLDVAREFIREAKSAAYLADLDSVAGLEQQLAVGMMAATSAGRTGIVYDVRQMVTPWEFDLGAIDVPAMFWYGSADDVVATSVGESLSARVRGSSLEIFEGASHLLPLTHWSSLLDLLARQFDREEHPCR